MHRANTLSALKYGTVSPESSRLTICIKRNGKVNRRGRVGWGEGLGEGLGEATAEMFKTTDLIQRLWYRAGICTKTDQDAGPEGLEKTDVNFYLLSNTPWFTESQLSDERICVLNSFLGLTPDTSLCRFKCLVLCVCVCVCADLPMTFATISLHLESNLRESRSSRCTCGPGVDQRRPARSDHHEKKTSCSRAS